MTTALANKQESLPALPELPEHYNPIRALGKEGKAELAQIILTHYEAGKSMYELAKILGVHPTSVYRLVTSFSEQEWREVTVARYQSIIEDCERDLETAADTVATTRARERMASARWMLERLNRRIYGQDAKEDSGRGVSITLNIGGENATNAAHNAVIDVESVKVADAS